MGLRGVDEENRMYLTCLIPIYVAFMQFQSYMLCRTFKLALGGFIGELLLTLVLCLVYQGMLVRQVDSNNIWDNEGRVWKLSSLLLGVSLGVFIIFDFTLTLYLFAIPFLLMHIVVLIMVLITKLTGKGF